MVAALDYESLPFEGLQMPPPRHEGHIRAADRQTRTEIAPNAACANDHDPHRKQNRHSTKHSSTPKILHNGEPISRNESEYIFHLLEIEISRRNRKYGNPTLADQCS
jgi:hypothetical protein